MKLEVPSSGAFLHNANAMLQEIDSRAFEPIGHGTIWPFITRAVIGLGYAACAIAATLREQSEVSLYDDLAQEIRKLEERIDMLEPSHGDDE